MIAPEPGIWTPCIYVPNSTACRFCWSLLPRSAPPGPRGGPVRAYYNATLNEWECVGCHEQLVQVTPHRERHAIDQAARVLPEPDTTGTGDGGASAHSTPEFALTPPTKAKATRMNRGPSGGLG